MVNLSTAQMLGLVSLGLILSAAVIVDNLEKSYYCEPEDNVKECLRLSSSGITCYFLAAEDLTKGDRCTGGVWQPLENSLDQQSPVGNSVKVRANGKEWICQADDGFVNPYTRCSSGGLEGYLGEFI
ncbi:hypothetical protein LCGC14_1557360 [marine sediment metagenome]|uniref:Uncharacterized protein n=1 Tax=marine sediment metagenome TaxID=412755 RepID=A0A0F9INM4_9ZZZZ